MCVSRKTSRNSHVRNSAEVHVISVISVNILTTNSTERHVCENCLKKQVIAKALKLSGPYNHCRLVRMSFQGLISIILKI